MEKVNFIALLWHTHTLHTHTHRMCRLWVSVNCVKVAVFYVFRVGCRFCLFAVWIFPYICSLSHTVARIPIYKHRLKLSTHRITIVFNRYTSNTSNIHTHSQLFTIHYSFWCGIFQFGSFFSINQNPSTWDRWMARIVVNVKLIFYHWIV